MSKITQRELTDVLLSSQKKYKPSRKVLKKANVRNYEETLKKAARNSVKFWEEAARELEEQV